MRPVVALSIAVVLAVAVGGLPMRPTAGPSVAPQQHTAPAEPGEGLLSARLAGAGAPPDGQTYAAALRQATSVPTSPLASLNPWQDRGPRNIGGRLTDLALSPDGATVYAAAASGGLWASRDGGVTLEPAWPPDLTPAIGAVAVTADGVLLAGTGEANAGGGSLTFGGTGVYRSTDGGRSWASAGLDDSGTVARIVPHPSRPQRVYLAAGGDLFAAGGQRGIYRSDDAGQTWDLVLPPATPTAGGADIAVDPADPDHLLASMWDRLRTPDQRRYGGPGSGLYTSRDGGHTWAPVAGGLPGFAADSGRIAIDFSPADPSRVYAVVTRGDGRSGGLWRSDDGGVMWSRVDDSPLYAPSQFIFGWWFSKVFAAPQDRDRVLVPGLSLLESFDGGVTFAPDDLVHADQHDLVWDPADPTRAWLATDGGMYASTEGGRTLTWRPTEDQGFTQLYDAAIPPAATDRLAGGFQDNGCLLTAGPADGWASSASCGDGVVVLPHPQRGDELILCGQHGRCRISTDHGASSRPLPMPATTRRNWSAPLIRVPGSPEQLLHAGRSVHRSIDGGMTWQAISGDLTRGRSPDPDYPFGTVTALAADGHGMIAAGTDDGLVWRSADDGVTWDRVAQLDRWVTAVVLTPHGLVVGTSGYRGGQDTSQVLLLAAQGAVDLAAGLPRAPVNDLVLVDLGTIADEGASGADDTGSGAGAGDQAAGVVLVAGTDVGVFLRPADPQHPQVWRRVGADLPQAPVTALDWVPATRQLTAATYGRGAWTIPLPALTRHAGQDRYATATAIVATLPSDDVDTVVLASGEDFPDALAAAARVAGDAHARLVLTTRDDLPQPSADLLAGLAPSAIVVVGGLAAVSDAVVTAAVQAAGRGRGGSLPTVNRLGGEDRYGTAAAVAGDVVVDTVVLATAGVAFDALAGAPYAATQGAPVLLVDPGRLPAATASALARLEPSTIVALGGQAAISQAVLAAAADAAGGAVTRRLAGATRDATAAAVADAMPSDAVVWLAASDRVPDALAAAATGAPVLLVGTATVPPVTLAVLQRRGATAIRLAGGPAVLSPALVTALLWGP